MKPRQRSKSRQRAAARHCAGGKDCWSPEEDEALKELVANNMNWSQVSQLLPGRTAKSCRLRWHNHLRDGIKRSAWSDWEQAIIILMQARDSTRNKWAAMAQLLPGRVDNSIKNHWHATLSRRLADGSVNNSYVVAGYELEQLLSMGPPAEERAAAASSGLLDSPSCLASGSGSGSGDCMTTLDCPDSLTGLGGAGDSSNCYDLSPSLLSLDSFGVTASALEQHSSGSANTITPRPSCLQPEGTNARTRKVLQQLFGGDSQPAAKRPALSKPKAPEPQQPSLFGSLLSHAWSAPADLFSAADSQVPSDTSSFTLLGRSESCSLSTVSWYQQCDAGSAGSPPAAPAAAGSGAPAVQPSVLLSWLQFGGSTAAVPGLTGAAGAVGGSGWQPGDADALAALVERVDSNSNGPQELAPPSLPMAEASTVPVSLFAPYPGAASTDRVSNSGGGLGSGQGLVARAGDSFDGLQPGWLEQALLEDDLLPAFDANDWTPLDLQ